MGGELRCFKAYDIRGRVPDELNADIAWRIGRAFAQFLAPRRVVIGHDIRLTSPELTTAVANGLCDGGADVLDIGCVGTEEVYFATANQHADGGIMVTASHNPMDYNGMKLVRSGARPISGDSGLDEIRRLAEEGGFATGESRGTRQALDSRPSYVAHLLSLVDVAALRPLRIVADPGNGGAGAVIDALSAHLPFEWVRLHFEPDGKFPNGVPNPLLPENRAATARAVREHGADLGLAWDGDFDRCFLFDERGEFVEGYYIVGLLAEAMLKKQPHARIIHDPRLTWNTIEIVRAHGGVPLQSKTGHAFIKERMRAEDAAYGGEMSAHHYFRDFFYCDTGMLSWLMVAELMSRSGEPLSGLIADRAARFPVSGEINRRLRDPANVLAVVEAEYADAALRVDHVDGLSMEFERWRFNLRASNTEPVVRLNVETRGDPALLRTRTDELLARLGDFGE